MPRNLYLSGNWILILYTNTQQALSVPSFRSLDPRCRGTLLHTMTPSPTPNTTTGAESRRNVHPGCTYARLFLGARSLEIDLVFFFPEPLSPSMFPPSFRTRLEQYPSEYEFCLAPDCTQIYRISMEDPGVIQRPAYLTEACSHKSHHRGLT